MWTIENKYKTWYYRIIERARNRLLDKNIYTEKHHIIPECFFKNRKRKGRPGWLEGDPDTLDNLVSLTLKEHMFVHILLPKFVSTSYAVDVMNFTKCNMIFASKAKGLYISSRNYENNRTEYLKMISRPDKVKYGAEKAAEVAKKIGDAKRGKTWEDIIGLERAIAKKARMSRPDIERYGPEKAALASIRKSIHQKGKTWEERFGVEGAAALRLKKNLKKN